eukprot:TRINITY_DN40136_c0_g1_i1.p1 TRINITY_DN40136_c0_g1~~TRINITY_DN40136_c0_g1_i1.p1  ORF type:complete len:208 (-),score=20.79 TRINITY_DN40136_c0_g1_i1:78-701(-)
MRGALALDLRPSLGFALRCLLIALLVLAVVASNVKDLTDGTFETDTQASTSGAATGDWFVKFYAPWCKHCKELEPTWEKLATALKGTTRVAKVDVDSSVEIAARFDLKSFPTLLLFRQGKMFQYEGPRTLESLKGFALGGYERTIPKIVPPQRSLVARVMTFTFKYGPTVGALLFIVGAAVGLVKFFSGVGAKPVKKDKKDKGKKNK